MSDGLRVLLVEDDEDDAWLITRALQRHGFVPEWERVDSSDGMADALDRREWHVVLADYFVPGFGALDALEMLTSRDLDVPLIVVSGIIGEETAVETMRAGARDYLLKNNLARLGPAIERELGEVSVRRARQDAERLLRESAAQLRRVLESSPDVIVRIDRDLCITLASPAVEQIAGTPSAEVIGERIAALGYPPEHADRIERHARRVLSSDEIAVIEHEVPTFSGSRWFETRLVPEHDDDGRCTHVLLTSRDITHRKGVERELTRRALQDPLTELPNRLLLEDRLGHAVARLQRDESIVAVLFVDLDRFKEINDVYGRDAGDEVLLHVARRLLGAVRPADTVARLGGDEFVILLEDAGDDAEVLAVAERVAQAVTPPILVDGADLSITASVGIASTRVGVDPDLLLRNADVAMYRAKQSGRGRCAVFDDRLPAHASPRPDSARDRRAPTEASQHPTGFAPQIDLTD